MGKKKIKSIVSIGNGLLIIIFNNRPAASFLFSVFLLSVMDPGLRYAVVK